MNNNISIEALIGRQSFSSDLSVNDLIKNMKAKKETEYGINDIIETQAKNKKQKEAQYIRMYHQVINLIYEKEKNHESSMIYSIPYVTELKDYNYDEFKKFLLEELKKNNIAAVPFKRYNQAATENQYLITWRFISCKK